MEGARWDNVRGNASQMWPKGIACVFYRHKTLEQSECICVSQQITDTLHIVSSCTTKVTATFPSNTSTARSKSLLLPPLASLEESESLSMMVSYAKYTARTRCHFAYGLSHEKAEDFWRKLAARTAENIFGSKLSAPRLKDLVMGVYITRSGSDSFTVGLVTQGTTRDPRVKKALSLLVGDQMSMSLDAELPICAAHRAMTVRLWWQPRTDRVTPRSVMPTIRVTLEKEQAVTHGEEKQLMAGYDSVNVFLCRPVASKFLGTTRKLLDNGEYHCADVDAEWQDKHEWAARAKGRRSGRKVVVILYFSNLAVVEVGEHLVGVEVEASPSYTAFVPSQYAHLPPFLVVAQNDG
uniref:Uncharacterized protein TCIL3000_11_14070 n=1 Tax=Trypanosoma congolense (strain IL3000) TaxID=1068625 RepID=G0V315_TRYCI|nr:unnamed protein product [Trypanosoma congolense IL3000]